MQRRQIAIIERYDQFLVLSLYDKIGYDYLLILFEECAFPRTTWFGIESLDLRLGSIELLIGDVEALFDLVMMHFRERIKIVAQNLGCELDSRGRGFLIELNEQAFLQVTSAYTSRVKGFDLVDNLLHLTIRNH